MEGVIIDLGSEVDRLLQNIGEQAINLVKILVTHGHIDHAGGVAALTERLNVPIEGPHKHDRFCIGGLAK